MKRLSILFTVIAIIVFSISCSNTTEYENTSISYECIEDTLNIKPLAYSINPNDEELEMYLLYQNLNQMYSDYMVIHPNSSTFLKKW